MTTKMPEKVQLAYDTVYEPLSVDDKNDVVAVIVIEDINNTPPAMVIKKTTSVKVGLCSDEHKLQIVIEHILGDKLFTRTNKAFFDYKVKYAHRESALLEKIQQCMYSSLGGFYERSYYDMLMKGTDLATELSNFKKLLGQKTNNSIADKLYAQFIVSLYRNLYPDEYALLINQLMNLRVEADSDANAPVPMIFFIHKSGDLDQTFKDAVTDKVKKSRNNKNNQAPGAQRNLLNASYSLSETRSSREKMETYNPMLTSAPSSGNIVNNSSGSFYSRAGLNDSISHLHPSDSQLTQPGSSTLTVSNSSNSLLGFPNSNGVNYFSTTSSLNSLAQSQYDNAPFVTSSQNAGDQKQKKNNNKQKISNEYDDPTAINNNGPASSIMLKILATMAATIGALVAGACAYALKNPMAMPWLTLHLSPAAIFVIAIGAVIVTLMSLYFLFKKGPSPRQSSPNSAGCLNFFKRLINPNAGVGSGNRQNYQTIYS